jgi:phenylacetate-CoA ligase
MNDSLPLRQRIFKMLMESQFWPPDRMLAYQRNQLTQLLHHARTQSPFYKTRLDAVFNPSGGIDWDRWHEIPIVTRAELRDNFQAMLAKVMPPGHGPSKTFRSSGSSGIPIAIETTQISSEAKVAAISRFYRNLNIDRRKTSARISHFAANGEKLHEEFYLKRRRRSESFPDDQTTEVVINRNLPEARKLELIESLGVSYLHEITNNAEILATANLHSKNPIKLDAVMSFSQALTDFHIDLFQRSFGARSFSIYSSKEGGLMGCQCGIDKMYHLNAELIHIEIVDADGKACEPGQAGRVIITPFFGTALPLVRYDQGDTAELHPSDCACGSKLPVLKNVTGRQDQILRLPDGPRAVGGLFQNLMRENLNALAFQLAQVAPLTLEIRYIPIDPNVQVEAAPILAHVHEFLHRGMDVVFKQIDKIPLNSGGKQQRVVCELDDEPTTS